MAHLVVGERGFEGCVHKAMRGLGLEASSYRKVFTMVRALLAEELVRQCQERGDTIRFSGFVQPGVNLAWQMVGQSFWEAWLGETRRLAQQLAEDFQVGDESSVVVAVDRGGFEEALGGALVSPQRRGLVPNSKREPELHSLFTDYALAHLYWLLRRGGYALGFAPDFPAVGDAHRFLAEFRYSERLGVVGEKAETALALFLAERYARRDDRSPVIRTEITQAVQRAIGRGEAKRSPEAREAFFACVVEAVAAELRRRGWQLYAFEPNLEAAEEKLRLTDWDGWVARAQHVAEAAMHNLTHTRFSRKVALRTVSLGFDTVGDGRRSRARVPQGVPLVRGRR